MPSFKSIGAMVLKWHGHLAGKKKIIIKNRTNTIGFRDGSLETLIKNRTNTIGFRDGGLETLNIHLGL